MDNRRRSDHEAYGWPSGSKRQRVRQEEVTEPDELDDRQQHFDFDFDDDHDDQVQVMVNEASALISENEVSLIFIFYDNIELLHKYPTQIESVPDKPQTQKPGHSSKFFKT